MLRVSGIGTGWGGSGAQLSGISSFTIKTGSGLSKGALFSELLIRAAFLGGPVCPASLCDSQDLWAYASLDADLPSGPRS